MHDIVVAVMYLQYSKHDVANQGYDVCQDKWQVVNKHTVYQPECKTQRKQERLPYRDVAGMSRPQGLALWLIYGMLIHDLPLILANIVPLICNIMLTILKLRYRNNDCTLT